MTAHRNVTKSPSESEKICPLCNNNPLKEVSFFRFLVGTLAQSKRRFFESLDGFGDFSFRKLYVGIL